MTTYAAICAKECPHCAAGIRMGRDPGGSPIHILRFECDPAGNIETYEYCTAPTKDAVIEHQASELAALRKRAEEAERSNNLMRILYRDACFAVSVDEQEALESGGAALLMQLHELVVGTEQRDAERTEVRGLREKLNTPELIDFSAAVVLEAAHQRERWTSTHDAGKEPQDWFWLLGYLAGKALKAHASGDTEKALHHTISSAAALANWHAAILGQTNMRPGISQEKQDAIAEPDGSRDKRIIREQIEEGARCPDCKELNGDCDCGNNDYVPGFDDGSPPDRDEDNTRNLGLEPRG
jgi:hypothetical protein